MNVLPTEILENIFIHLPQEYNFLYARVCRRWKEIIYQPLFFTIIELYTIKQLENYIQTAKKIMINNKPINYYTRHLKVYFTCIPNEKTALDLLLTFPNIQSINGLSSLPTLPAFYINDPYPSLGKLTHFSLWYTTSNKAWMKSLYDKNNNARNIKLLEFNIDDQPNNNNNNNSLSIPSLPIHLKQTLNQGIHQLVLPALNYLTVLNIFFSHERSVPYTINENSLESIYKSCPQLESLTLFNIKITISGDNYSIPTNGQQYKLATHPLKHISIHGVFLDSRCYTYFSLKCPLLTSLQLYLKWNHLTKESNLLYHSAIHNMMLQYTQLKKLSVSFYENPETLFNYNNNESNYEEFWPRFEFLNWLQQHPTQLNDLSFHYDFLNNNSQPGSNSNEYNHINKVIQQPTFLDYLTFLSLGINNATNLVANYLLQNENKTIVSTTIKSLELRGNSFYGSSNHLNIYDWLDMFPGLISLKIEKIKYIKGNSKDYDDSRQISLPNDKFGSWKSRELHALLKRRKRFMFRRKSMRFYKLESLSITLSNICFQAGINELFKKCNRLKELNLENVCYTITIEVDYNKIYSSYGKRTFFFSLGFHHLKFISIKQLKFIPYVGIREDTYIINEVILKQTALKNKHRSKIITSPEECARYTKSSLYLLCGQVDTLLVNS
ncbi:hypothetical protein BJ944DRAFT_247200 [Cunninghamella echinulata]|nr:hypothetical protein BJ944DRAFT_247200 [Cunninghamella echinulata]